MAIPFTIRKNKNKENKPKVYVQQHSHGTGQRCNACYIEMLRNRFQSIDLNK